MTEARRRPSRAHPRKTNSWRDREGQRRNGSDKPTLYEHLPLGSPHNITRREYQSSSETNQPPRSFKDRYMSSQTQIVVPGKIVLARSEDYEMRTITGSSPSEIVCELAAD